MIIKATLLEAILLPREAAVSDPDCLYERDFVLVDALRTRVVCALFVDLALLLLEVARVYAEALVRVVLLFRVSAADLDVESPEARRAEELPDDLRGVGFA